MSSEGLNTQGSALENILRYIVLQIVKLSLIKAVQNVESEVEVLGNF